VESCLGELGPTVPFMSNLVWMISKLSLHA
jgi:hypothetical protein